MESNGAAGLDRLSNTFSRDRDFCDALAKTQPSATARLFVYLRWAHMYLPSIQEELHAMAERRFEKESWRDAAFWTMTLTAGIYKDLGLIPYLIVRGIIWDAGFAVRRSLESAGVLAHLWSEPGKATLLSEPESGAYKNAFVAETDSTKAAELKSGGIQKRFAACNLARPMSALYQLFSAYSIHGGSPKQIVRAEVEPTRQSCMFVNRPDPAAKSLARDVALFGNALEILCAEVSFVHGTFSKKFGLQPSKGSEGGFFLSKMLDTEPGSVMDGLIADTVQALGWSNPPS